MKILQNTVILPDSRRIFLRQLFFALSSTFIQETRESLVSFWWGGVFLNGFGQLSESFLKGDFSEQ